MSVFMCIHSSTNGYLGCFHVFDIVNNAAVNIKMHNLSQLVLSYSLDEYLEVEMLDHMVVLVLIFKGLPYHFHSDFT